MTITRERYIIMRNNRTEVYCGGYQNFKSINNIGTTNFKAYESEHKAITSFGGNWKSLGFDWEVVKIKETIEI